LSYFTQIVDAYHPASNPESLTRDLPPGNYSIEVTPFGNYFFTKGSNFTQTSKVYGSLTKVAERIFNTFLLRQSSTGAAFVGQKGSGKTQLSRLISMLGYEQGIPTIVVNSPIKGDFLGQILHSVQQPKIVLMDEFEKVFSRELQETVLSLFDGTSVSKTLFILTANDKWKLDTNLINRPGRVFYFLEFSGMEAQAVEEYIHECLNNQVHAPNLIKLANSLAGISFDTLKAIVEEMNRYDEDVLSSVKLLNISLNDYSEQDFKTELLLPNGKRASWCARLTQNPLYMKYPHIHRYSSDDNDESVPGSDVEDGEVEFERGDLKTVNIGEGRFELLNKDGFKLIAVRRRESVFDADRLLGW
jgi:hypothetical protein